RPQPPPAASSRRLAPVRDRGWNLVRRVEDIALRPKEGAVREALLKAEWRRGIDAVLVRRLDRRGRSLPGLVVTPREPTELDVGFVPLTESLDLTTPTPRSASAPTSSCSWPMATPGPPSPPCCSAAPGLGCGNGIWSLPGCLLPVGI